MLPAFERAKSTFSEQQEPCRQLKGTAAGKGLTAARTHS